MFFYHQLVSKYFYLLLFIAWMCFGHIQRAQVSLTCTAYVVTDMTVVDCIHHCHCIIKIKILESLKLVYSEVQHKIIFIRH